MTAAPATMCLQTAWERLQEGTVQLNPLGILDTQNSEQIKQLFEVSMFRDNLLHNSKWKFFNDE